MNWPSRKRSLRSGGRRWLMPNRPGPSPVAVGVAPLVIGQGGDLDVQGLLTGQFPQQLVRILADAACRKIQVEQHAGDVLNGQAPAIRPAPCDTFAADGRCGTAG